MTGSRLLVSGALLATTAIAAAAVPVAAAPRAAAVVRSLTFARVPAGYALTGIAFEDLTDPNASLFSPLTSVQVSTPERMRAVDAVGPAVSANGRAWIVAVAGAAVGTRGEVVFRFSGPRGVQLCATSPPVRLPNTGNWAYVRVPLAVSGKGVVTLPRYTWIRSLDARWTRRAPAVRVYLTPNATGYTFTFFNLPLTWRLRFLRFVAGHHVLSATVAQAFGLKGPPKNFAAVSAGWSFTYPEADAGWRGQLEGGFSTAAKGRVTWVVSAPFTLRR